MSTALFIQLIALIVIFNATMLLACFAYTEYIVAQTPRYKAKIEKLVRVQEDDSDLDQHFGETPDPLFYSPRK